MDVIFLKNLLNERGRAEGAKGGEEGVLIGEGVSDKILEIHKWITRVRLSGAVISRKMLINIDNGVLEANDLKILSKFGGYITLTEDWAGGIVQSIDWVKRKGTNGKIEPFPQLRAEERFTFQKSIAPLAYDHNIPSDLIINLVQTPLSYVSPGKYLFNLKEGAKNVPINVAFDKREITTTFADNATGNCFPMQLIYTGKIKNCLPNVEFPLSFHVTYTESH